MGNKKVKILVLAALGVVSFAASFMVTRSLRTAGPGGATVAAVEGQPMQVDPDLMVLGDLAAAGSAEMKPKEKQLDELIKEVRAKLEELKRQEKHLNERQKRLAMVSDRLRAQIKELQDLKVELASTMTPLENERAKLLRFRALIKNQEVANLEAAAKMWAKMEPSNAARLIVEMQKTNQSLAATKIFRFLPEKAKAAIMDEIKEMAPAVRIIEQQLNVVREQDNLQ